MNTQKKAWEVDNIDLNLKNYIGHPSDVIKKIKYSIEKYLSTSGVPKQQVEIYSAIYNALEYYSSVSYIPPAEFDTEDSFLSCAIEAFNQDYEYLSKKYNSPDPTEEPVIAFSARIKSPLSFMEKVKEKITEYINKGRDLKYFNESLRDLLGVRIIINPPKEVKARGKQAECEFEYQVFYDFVHHHGIDFEDSSNSESNFYNFININTRYDTHKLQKIKERASKEGFAPEIKFGENPTIFIPEHGIPEVENPDVSSKLKDYVMYPKFSGYQSIHVCAVPDFSDYVDHQPTPACIIPQANNDYYIEYQIRTEEQNNFAEHGLASHKKTYKPHENEYHRLSVPLYIEIDGPQDISDNSYNKSNAKKSTYPRFKKLKLRNFAESLERFYGYSFKDRFGISFKDFRDSFSTTERDEILASRRTVHYNKENDYFYTEPSTTNILLTSEEIVDLKEKIQNSGNDELGKILDELGISYKINNSVNGTTPKFKIIRMMPKGKRFPNKNIVNTSEKSSPTIDEPSLDD